MEKKRIKENCKRGGGKFKMGRGKRWKMSRGPFFFSFFFFFFFYYFASGFGGYQIEIFYREKAFHAGKKIKKNDFAPSEKFSCYAPGANHPTINILLCAVLLYIKSTRRILKILQFCAVVVFHYSRF